MKFSLSIFLLAALLATCVSATDRYTFEPVPPPSRFSGEIVYPTPTNLQPVLAQPAPAVQNAEVIRATMESKPPPVSVEVPTINDKQNAPPEKIAEPAKPEKQTSKLIINADNEIGGKVVSTDDAGRFVILNFPLGLMPPVDSTMTVYHHGVKVGQIKITGPQRDDNIAADVISGGAQADDSVRGN